MHFHTLLPSLWLIFLLCRTILASCAQKIMILKEIAFVICTFSALSFSLLSLVWVDSFSLVNHHQISFLLYLKVVRARKDTNCVCDENQSPSHIRDHQLRGLVTDHITRLPSIDLLYSRTALQLTHILKIYHIGKTNPHSSHLTKRTR